MKITMEVLHRVVLLNRGPVSILDSTGKTRPLKDGTADTWAMIKKAETFLFGGLQYNRTQFENVLDKVLSKN